MAQSVHRWGPRATKMLPGGTWRLCGDSHPAAILTPAAPAARAPAALHSQVDAQAAALLNELQWPERAWEARMAPARLGFLNIRDWLQAQLPASQRVGQAEQAGLGGAGGRRATGGPSVHSTTLASLAVAGLACAGLPRDAWTQGSMFDTPGWSLSAPHTPMPPPPHPPPCLCPGRCNRDHGSGHGGGRS